MMHRNVEVDDSPSTGEDIRQLALSWRIFPPPCASPRRTKKKRKKMQQQQQHHQSKSSNDQGEGKGSSSSGQGERNDQQQERPEKQKELWQQKQQQYQYTYPYEVGDRIIMLVPQEKHQTREIETETSNSENPKQKQQKLSETGSSKTIQNANNTVQTKSNTNHLVPVPVRVDKITGDENNKQVHLSRSGVDNPIALSPKEQRKLLCPILGSIERPSPSTRRPCTVILVEETLPFRNVARFQLDNGGIFGSRDRVLEIGCSTGELSKLIWRNHLEGPCPKAGEPGGPSWIGMDHSQEMIDRCREQLDQHMAAHVRENTYASKVVKVDALAEPKRALAEATTPAEVFGPVPTVVLIDIGGNRECGPVVRTLAWVLKAFGWSQDLRMVIVKSRALVRQLQTDCELKNPITDANTTTNAIPSLDTTTGIVSRGTEWFLATQQKLSLERKNRFEQRFKHPLKAPKVLSPVDGITPICRYHNYHKDGCKLHKDLGTHCPLDHDHCHFCLEKGHLAKNCPKHQTQSCY